MSKIQLHQVSLNYKIPVKRSLKTSSIGLLTKLFLKKQSETPQSKIHKALNKIDLPIEDGDRIGLIGKNGAGKSTLLKVIANIYSPTSGHIDIEGDVSALFSTNVGLNLSATGYENIISLGLLRGKTKKEMQDLFEEIKEFTELGDFLRFPMKTYSSGMKLRLIFAVLTSMKPDILLMDEIIGAGDAGFKDKAEQRLNNLIESSQILVVASHSISIIEQLCNKVLVLNKGNLVFFGDVEQGIKCYTELN